MNYFSLLKQRKDELDQSITKAQKITNSPVPGRIEIAHQGPHFRYYLISSGKKRTYLKVSELGRAKKIVEHNYATQFLRLAKKESRLLHQLSNLYENNHAFICHEKLHPGRKALTSPLLMSDDEYAAQWMAKPNLQDNTYPLNSVFYTENGELVRSKSEKIIADKLKHLNVPYKYEFALKLNRTVYFPDFTILNKTTRQTYYWEHFGLIDQPEYRNSMIQKIEAYTKSNIIVGKNLIITFETKDQPLSVKQVDTIIKEIFLPCESNPS